MNLIEYAKRAAVRRVIYLIIALIAAGIVGEARAQTAPPYTCNGSQKCDRQQAYAECQTFVSYSQAVSPGNGPYSCALKPPAEGGGDLYKCSSSITICYGAAYFAWHACPAGTNWDEATKTCAGTCPPGEVDDPEHPGQCLSGEDCLARNVNMQTNGSRAWPSKCISGCNLVVTAATSHVTNGQTIWHGKPEYDGQVCTGGVVQTPDPDGTRTDEKTKPQECVPAGSGQTMCVKSNGENCYTASSGRQMCWTPGETGIKTDGPIAQVRKPGTDAAPPNIVLPNGETGAKTGSTVQTTTTTTNNTIVTSTTNYASPNGTDAGDDNNGQNDDGTGDSEGDENTSSGGQDCAAAPTSSGDPILGNILFQSWKNRCNGENHKSSGAGNCQAEFKCAGEEILCSLAMEKRKERCDYEQRRTQNITDANASIAQGDGTAGIEVGDMYASNDGLEIDDGLLGGDSGGQCDFTFTLGGQPVVMDSQWWTVVALIKAIIVILAYLWIVRQLGK